MNKHLHQFQKKDKKLQTCVPKEQKMKQKCESKTIVIVKKKILSGTKLT